MNEYLFKHVGGVMVSVLASSAVEYDILPTNHIFLCIILTCPGKFVPLTMLIDK
jgi:hypothetical protein